MSIYIIILFILFVSLIIANHNRLLEKPLYYVNVIFLIFISTFRDISVGVDTANYYNSFIFFDSNDVRGVEVGWMLINYICRNYFNSFTALQIIVSILIFTFFTKSVNVYSKNRILSLILFVILYYYFNSFNITRQILACCICLYSLKYLKGHQIVKYIIWVLIAMSIHSSAVIMLPMYYISNLSFPKPIIVAILLSSYIIPNYIMPVLYETLASNELYSMYLGDLLLTRSDISMNLLLHTIILIFILYFSKYDSNYMLLFIVGVFFTNVFSSQEVIARIGLYFKLSLVLLIPNLKWKFNSPYIRYFATPIIVVLLLFACIIMLIANDSGVCPYKMI
ncbi:MAG: EpsG family protein [Lentimicrobiaceae bacterium]|nr:EpsG family protein [Lentimicrobiaceae bacterium]